ncbi:MAG: M3 family oligoendopeptidase [Chloroflexota bacterium]
MSDAVQERVTGAENVIWDLTPLYSGPDDPALTSDIEAAEAMADAFVDQYRGGVADLDAAGLNSAMQQLEALSDLAGKPTAYASLIFSTETNNPRYGALVQRMQEFDARIEQKIVFFDLEWNNVPDDQAEALLADPVLSNYAHHLEARRRYKPHLLSEPQEQVILEKDIVGVHAWDRFFTQLTSSIRYEFEGQELTQSQILTKAFEPDREVRRKAADSVTAGLRGRLMETTYVFNMIATNKSIDDRLRGYPTWITSRNLANKAPDSVVDALVETVTSSYALVARHYNLKRVLLGYEELMDYDRYAPLPLKGSDKFYTWDEARKIVLDAFYAFNETIGSSAARFFDERWIHAPIMPGKRGGAYAHPLVPSVHPYVFTNYSGTNRDVMTLAHELGHGIHMLLSGQKSGLFGLYTPLTTAETASTFGEMLVFNDLLEREDDPAVQLSMMAGKIEDSFSTIFRQIAMNRFEHGLHTARRSEGELNTDRISALWMETQKAMFGDSVTLRDDYAIWWSYIPHFVGVPGYVYAYAFGELLVLALYKIYQKEGPDFAPKYVDVLAAGNSDYPDQIMGRLGVDLNDPGFWRQGIAVLRELVEREEQLAREVFPDRF